MPSYTGTKRQVKFAAFIPLRFTSNQEAIAISTAKDEVKTLLDKLPDNCSLEDVQYHLYVVEKIRKGIERAEKEGGVDQEEVERKLSK